MSTPTDDTSINVESVGVSYSRERTAEQVLAAIEKSFEDAQTISRPKRIRASAIGKECGRELAYDFLWATEPKAFIGRMLRLFEDGEKAEAELIGYLKTVGWEVIDRDPNDSRKQIWVEFLDGHGGGYLDGLGRDKENTGPWRIVEIKTFNERNFSKLKKDGVEISKPEHAGQMSIYGFILGVPKAIYLAKNKGTSELYAELIHINESYVQRIIERAELIVGKRVLPPKIGSSVNSHKCKFCPHAEGVCHGGASPSRNCRTCGFSKTLSGGSWACAKHECLIENRELMNAGCDDYEVSELFTSPI